MYSVGDYISYGNSGVCEVMGTEVMDESATFFVLFMIGPARS